MSEETYRLINGISQIVLTIGLIVVIGMTAFSTWKGRK